MLEVLYSKKQTFDMDGSIFASRKYFYCPTCKKPINRCADYREYECEDFNVIKIKCENCKTVHYIKCNQWISKANVLQRRRNTRLFGSKALTISRIISPSGIKTDEMVVHDEENGNIALFVRFINLIPTQNSLLFEPYYCKYILNYKKHTAYVINNKTYKGKRAFGSNGQTIINHTNARCGLRNGHLQIWNMSVEGVESLAENYFRVADLPLFDAFIAKLKNEHLDGKNFGQNSYKAAICELLNSVNRFPNLLIQYDAYKATSIVSQSCGAQFISAKFVKSFPKEITDYHGWIREEIEKHRLPKSKSFWKLYLDDVKFIDRTVYLKSCGFTNSDIMRTILKDNRFFSYFDNCTNNSYFDVAKLTKAYNRFIQVIKRMLANSTEISVGKKLNNCGSCIYISDIANMFDEVYKYDKKLLDSIDWSGSIKEIHDDFSLVSTKIQYANVQIPYKAHERALEREVEGFSFSLANDTNELVAIGQEMKICVGSYRDAVLSKRSTIISMKYQHSYIGCIEVDLSGQLIQMKGKCNTYLVGDAAQAAKRWANIVGLKATNRCVDFQNLGKTLVTDADYHHLEIDDNGNVFDKNLRNDVIFDFEDELPF